MLKQGIRILAIDDSPFSKKDKTATAIGVLGRKGVVEGVLSFKVKVDGADATKKIISKVKVSRFHNQTGLIALHGITLAGLNLVDMIKLNSELRVPVMALTRKIPSRKRLENAMKAACIKNLAEAKRVLAAIHNKTASLRSSGLHIQYTAMTRKEVEAHAEDAMELLRLAHLIASGVVTGESKGRL